MNARYFFFFARYPRDCGVCHFCMNTSFYGTNLWDCGLSCDDIFSPLARQLVLCVRTFFLFWEFEMKQWPDQRQSPLPTIYTNRSNSNKFNQHTSAIQWKIISFYLILLIVLWYNIIGRSHESYWCRLPHHPPSTTQCLSPVLTASLLYSPLSLIWQRLNWWLISSRRYSVVLRTIFILRITNWMGYGSSWWP